MAVEQKAFQDYYPDHLSWCYGCGRLNPDGLRVRSFWAEDGRAVCTFTPGPQHTAIPGYVYGGLIASLIDCHCTGTAAAARYRAEGRSMDSEPAYRFVTASLKVDYLRPTPLAGPLTVHASVLEITGRTVTLAAELSAAGQVCARGQVVAAQMPERFLRPPG